jgi:cell division protein FtsQ
MARKQGQARRKQKFKPGFGWVKPLIALISVAGSALGLTFMLDWMNDPYQWPVSEVRIEGDLRHLRDTDLRKTVEPLAATGFFVMDVSEIQARLQSMAWVEQVSVRRVWPDQLHIGVREQRAVAHWGADSFINARAEVFNPEHVATLKGLPQLLGPEGHEQRVLNMYREMQKLLKPLQLDVVSLSLDARRAWELNLSNGLKLAVGRNHPLRRVARFVKVYPAILAAGKGQLTAVDLRYSNGFAASWQEMVNTAKRSG